MDDVVNISDETIVVWLRRCGKRCFVENFSDAWRSSGELSENQLVANTPSDKPLDESSKTTKKYQIRRIFSEGVQCRALKKCFSVQGDPGSEKKARELHSQYC